MSTAIALASFFGGILPAILWLEFWLRRSTHREPRHLLLGTFLLGMASVFIAGPLEKAVSEFVIEYTALSLTLWALIEELIKYGGAYFVALRTRFCDDSIDPAIYLVTSALGFAAAENILFLMDAVSQGDIGKGVTTIILRSVGATVVHIISSGVIGIAIGIAFSKSSKVRAFALGAGFCFSVLLHATFNSFIINAGDKVLWVFGAVWILLIAIVIAMEKIKSTKRITQAAIS